MNFWHLKKWNIIGRLIENLSLPYKNKDFSVQLKVLFIAKLLIFLFITLSIIIITTIYTQLINPQSPTIQWPIILTEIGVLLTCIICLYILYKGYNIVVSHIFLILTYLAAWYIMYATKGEIIAKLDTVVFVFVVFTTMPLIITENKYAILGYTAFNIALLFLFMYLLNLEFNLSRYLYTEYTRDIGFALITAGIIIFYVFDINQKAMDKALNDIKAREKAEIELKHSEEKFKVLIELLPYSVLVTDLQGQFITVNEAFCKELGCSKEEAIGKTSEYFDYKIDVNTLTTVNELLTKYGIVENFETQIIKKNNKVEYAIFSSRIINFDNQNYILSSSINITDRKKTEQELDNYRKKLEILVDERTKELAVTNEELSSTNEELQAANEELYSKNELINERNEELNKALQELKDTQLQLIQSEKMASLGILTAGVAHEINNPLNFILGGLSGLTNYFQENELQTDEKINTCLNSIKTGVERATTIVKSLNHFSRRKDTFNEICDIHSVIDNCLIMLNNSLKNRVVVNKNYSNEPVILKGNLGKMHQIFLNILNNANQAIQDQGEININTLITTENIIILISDNGSGISSSDMPKIMDPFFTTKEPGKGTGLGLTITYSLIKEHSGTIEISSELKKGTMVKVIFPI